MSDKKVLKPTTKKREDDILNDNLDEIIVDEIQTEEIDVNDLYGEEYDTDEDIVEEPIEKAKVKNTKNKKQVDELEKLIKDTQEMEDDEHEERMRKNFSDEKSAKEYLKGFRSFIKSKEFDKKCEELSILHKVDKKRVAETFSQKVLAYIGKALDIAIDVTYNATMFLVNFLSNIIKAACGVICTIANRIANFLTLGYSVISD